MNGAYFSVSLLMKTLLRALSYFRPDAGRVGVVLALLLVSVGLNVLKPWPFALLVDNVLGKKPYPAWAPETVKNWNALTQITAIALALLAVSFVQALCSAVQTYVSTDVGLRGLRRVRNDVFGWLQRLSLHFHRGTAAGDMIFRAGNDTGSFQALFQQGLLVFVSAFCTLLFMLIVMFRLNVRLTLLALISAPVLLILMKVLSREMRARGLEAQQAESKVYSLIHQGISVLQLVQSNTREQHEQRRFNVQTEKARRFKMSQHGLEITYWFVISLILTASTVAVTWFGAREVLASKLSLGELLVFIAYLGQMFEPLSQLSQLSATLSSAGASIHRVFEILDTPDEVKDRADARVVRKAGQLAGVSSRVKSSGPSDTPPIEAHGNLHFENVSFNYSDSKPALRGINFQVVAGESIAVIGPSGAGKTTLLNLLPRFYDPHGGAVLLEGVDLRQLRVKDLRAQIALVLQEPIILPATIAENISYGRPDARQSEIEAAARAANAEEFIRRLPLHYKTRVGEAGVRLSVGETQRISLARAFLKNAPLLLMDEPTSALDVESETQVAASFFELMRGRTTLMVAHRLSTIRRVNKILVIEDGQVSEFGTPEELLARPGYYARVIAGQSELPA
jgi:ATP-binding cassette subfamily B protein/subfamily B ATP-binding cassette protein MsbA